MVGLTPHPEGWVIPVRAQPRARRHGIQGEHAGALRIAVTAPAQEGRANKALLEVLREALNLPSSAVEIIGGDKGRQKRVLVRGMGKEELETKLNTLLTL